MKPWPLLLPLLAGGVMFSGSCRRPPDTGEAAAPERTAPEDAFRDELVPRVDAFMADFCGTKATELDVNDPFAAIRREVHAWADEKVSALRGELDEAGLESRRAAILDSALGRHAELLREPPADAR